MGKSRRRSCSLTEFRRNTRSMLVHLKETRAPIVLTVRGKPDLVVQDVESYQALLDRLDRLETIEGIRRGLEQEERGEGRPVEEVFAEFRARHGIGDG